MRHSVHIVHPREQRKRFEQLVRGFVIRYSELEHARSSPDRETASTVVLTARETEILPILATGASSESIARQLHISQATVRNHIKHILAKLNATVDSRQYATLNVWG